MNAISLLASPNVRLEHRSPGAVCLCARCTILEDPITSGGAQGVELERHFLIERRNSCMHDRSGPWRFSRTRPFFRPTIILSGFPL